MLTVAVFSDRASSHRVLPLHGGAPPDSGPRSLCGYGTRRACCWNSGHARSPTAAGEVVLRPAMVSRYRGMPGRPFWSPRCSDRRNLLWQTVTRTPNVSPQMPNCPRRGPFTCRDLKARSPRWLAPRTSYPPGPGFPHDGAALPVHGL